MFPPGQGIGKRLQPLAGAAARAPACRRRAARAYRVRAATAGAAGEQGREVARLAAVNGAPRARAARFTAASHALLARRALRHSQEHGLYAARWSTAEKTIRGLRHCGCAQRRAPGCAASPQAFAQSSLFTPRPFWRAAAALQHSLLSARRGGAALGLSAHAFGGTRPRSLAFCERKP